MKNSMALISGIFGLEAEGHADGTTRRVFEEAQDRVRTISAIYDLLSRSPQTPGIDSGEELGELVELFRATYLADRPGIAIGTRLEPVALSMKQGTDIGLIVNELLTNALKYGCPPGTEGRIDLELFADGPSLHVVVSDEGPGLPVGFDAAENGHLGFDLVRLLTSQYGGAMALSKGPGLRVEITMPVEEPSRPA